MDRSEWEQIKAQADKGADAYEAEMKKLCPCGGKKVLESQALAYSSEADCMIDKFVLRCSDCSKETVLTVPLEGPTYDSMVRELKERGLATETQKLGGMDCGTRKETGE